MKYRFYKSETGQWYIDLPKYLEEGIGKQANLEMVEGADKMLDILSEGRDEVTLSVETSTYDNHVWKEGGHLLTRVQIHSGDYTGASYKANIDEYTDLGTVNNVFSVWLCDVTKYVFGDFPEVIYVRKTN